MPSSSWRRSRPCRTGTSLPLLACILAGTVASACDESFDPLAPSEVHFSVFGYLDASADTQWIRVMPLRALKPTSPDSFGIAVTLEDLGSGRVIELRDSLFLYTHYSDPELGSGGAWLHNFWTTEEIEPGASYRLTVQREGEAPGEAVVKIPGDFASEVGLRQSAFGGETDYVRVTGLTEVPFVAVNLYFTDQCGPGVENVWRVDDDRPAAQYDTGDGYRIPISRASVTPRDGCGAPTLQDRRVWIVGSGAEWPSKAGYSPLGLGETERTSNVSNAVGFVGGVVTKLLPYENCGFYAWREWPELRPDSSQAPHPEHCWLRYDGSSATLEGTVTETRCGDGPVEEVTLQLVEMDGIPPEARQVRPFVTGSDGRFRIGALKPGMRYFLKARAKPVPIFGSGEFDVYTLRYDTLTFMAGEEMEYDIGLRRLNPCDQDPYEGRPAATEAAR